MYNSQKVGAVIVAAGRAERMRGSDKIMAPLGNTSVLENIISVFKTSPYIDYISLVLKKELFDFGKAVHLQSMSPKIMAVCMGGSRRQDSVAAGLASLPACEWVLIHDGARPFVTHNLIAQGLEAAQESGASAAAVPVSDTIKTADENLCVQKTLDRKRLWAVQTPQVFRLSIINQAYSSISCDVTDDASAAETIGIKVKLFMGDYENIKITTPNDLLLAELIATRRNI